MAFLRHMEMIAPLGTMKKDVGCICARLSTSDKSSHSVPGKEFEIVLRGLDNGSDLKVYHI